MDRSTEGAAQTSVLGFELFPAESIENNRQCLFAETSNIGIRDKWKSAPLRLALLVM
jgi:hypothetical protein